MADMKDRPINKLRRGGRVAVEFCGAVIALLGGLAFLAPLLAPALAAIVFAGVLLAAGAVGALALVPGRQDQFVWRALWVGVASLAGLAVLFHHWTGRLSLPWVVGLGSIALAMVTAAQVVQRRLRRRWSWGWLAVGAIFTVGLGALLVRAGPHTGVMVLALFVAGNLVAYGAALVVTGLTDRASASLL